jgi:trimeric autotransporter adhesin
VLTATQLVVDSVSLSDGVHGELASNYSLSAGQTGVATVTPAPLTASATAPNKVYDGNTTAAPTLAITAGLVAGEQLGVTGTASFNSKDVLTANVVTVDSISLADGTGLASNYSLSAGQTTAAFITPAALTASVTAPNKVYDGTTTATPSLSITAGLVGAEQLSLSGTASFNTKDVLTANLVTVDSVTLSDGVNGELASNYSLSTGQTTAAFITPASLTVTDVAAASAVTGSFKPGAAVLVGVLGADKVTGSVSLDSPDYSSPGFLKVGDYKQAVNTLSGEDAGNYAVAAFTTALANYTVTALPVKAPVAQAVAVAALTQLPANVTTQRLNDSRANLQTAANPSSSNAKSEVSSANSNTATSNASTNTTANASSNPQSSATQTSNTLSQGPATASESFGSLNTQTNNANTRSPNLLQASLKVPVRGSTAVAPNLNLLESSLVAGFNELDQDFSLPSPTAPGLPDVFSSAPTTLETNSTGIDDITLDFEERIYAGIREVIQSPLTYQVLTGASSVAFLVKTLLPSWLPSFQVPGSLPNPAPVRVPTSPGAMASGRTSLGRWLGRA